MVQRRRFPFGTRARRVSLSRSDFPNGHSAYLTTHAEGTQNYVCVLAGEGFGWQFFGPQATMLDAGGEQVATYFLSPNPDEAGVPAGEHLRRGRPG
jgi:hypothetical protein